MIMADVRRILIGVTADSSLRLMRGFPEYLQNRGWEVHVACAPGPLLSELGRDSSITIHSLPMTREPRVAQDLRSLAAWVRLLRRVRPDVVMVGTPKAGLLGSLAARLTRVPYRVYQLRGLRLETTSGALRRLLTSLERFTMNNAHDVVAVSPSLRQRAIDLRLVEQGRIHVLGKGSSNGVAIPPTVPTPEEKLRTRLELGLDPTVPVIGFVGRLTVDKGLHILASARRMLVTRGVDHQMLIVGGNDESASTSVSDELSSAGRPATRTGQVRDASGYYAAMDVLCLPTLREGFPNVVLEASAASVPTVTTNATGAIDSVVDGETGLIAAVGDPVSLADKLQVMIQAGNVVRAEFGERARRRVHDEFSRERVWSTLERFLGTGFTTRLSQ